MTLRFRIEPGEALQDRLSVGLLGVVGRADPFVDEIDDADRRGTGDSLSAGITTSHSAAAVLRSAGVSVNGQSSPGR